MLSKVFLLWMLSVQIDITPMVMMRRFWEKCIKKWRSVVRSREAYPLAVILHCLLMNSQRNTLLDLILPGPSVHFLFGSNAFESSDGDTLQPGEFKEQELSVWTSVCDCLNPLF